MAISTVFINNCIQAVHLPFELQLPENVKLVHVRAVGNERIISPIDSSWDSFFLGGPIVSEDFFLERASQEQSDREYIE
jgi:antitoxin VapB